MERRMWFKCKRKRRSWRTVNWRVLIAWRKREMHGLSSWLDIGEDNQACQMKDAILCVRAWWDGDKPNSRGMFTDSVVQ